MSESETGQLASILKQQRIAQGLSKRQLAIKCGISPSHVGRIEQGERFPSGHVLRKFAKPLGFDESELFASAGFLSPLLQGKTPARLPDGPMGVDPGVAQVLAQESVEIQYAVIGILTILKSLNGVARESQS